MGWWRELGIIALFAAVGCGGDGQNTLSGGALGSAGTAGIGIEGAGSGGSPEVGGRAGPVSAGTGASGGANGGGASNPLAGAGGTLAGASGAAGASGVGGASGAGSGTAASGAGNAAPAADVAPCPTTGDCKILPLGDSITDGIGSPGGYRVPLFRLAAMDGKKITFVGGSMNGPMTVDGQAFPRNHEGHSGWTIAQIDRIVPEPALSVAPHIVLLHIGTNDMYMTPAGAPDRLGTLIDQIVEALPDALLVVAKIIPLGRGSSAVETFNAALPALVQERIDAGKHVLLIDQFEGFPTSELGDGVHPNAAGYSRMADKWYAAISRYLN